MKEMIKQLGCIWSREMQAMLAGKIFTILLGYIIKENGVAIPYVAAINGSLTDEQRNELRQYLRLSKPIVIGEYDEDWEWHTWEGEKIDTLPKIDSPKKVMEREADINMVFLQLFTSLEGMQPKIMRELINAGLLTRIYLHMYKNDNEWLELKKNPNQFTLYAMEAMRKFAIEQISFLPYINEKIVHKLVNHLDVLPMQSVHLAKCYLSFCLEALRTEYQLTLSPSYWVEDVVENMKEQHLLQGELVDLSSLFTSKLLFCGDQAELTRLIDVEISSHFLPQAKMFALLSGDLRMDIRENWMDGQEADTLFAELNTNNIFRICKQTSRTLRPKGYGCWFMESKLEALASALLNTDPSNYKVKEKYYYESTNLGSWVAILFFKPEEE